jgi:hypothetical protein
MTMPISLSSSLRRLGAAALVLLGVVAGCGGVDSGGTGAPTTTFASGAITGFGSIIVNAIHFDDSSASVRDGDGNVRSRDDLRLGMTVEAHGDGLFVDTDSDDASTATSIVFASAILGPVDTDDAATRTLTVLGQAVDVTAATVFDDALPGGQAALAIGDVVEVYANLDVSTGRYAATRIERKTAVASYALRGVVAGLDTSARTFAIGGARIGYGGLPTAAIPPTLANGHFVRVALAVVQGGGGVWSAIRIDDGAPSIDDRDHAEVEGLISAFTSAMQFSVDGTPVDARNAQFPGGTGGLGLGKRVEVEGSIDAGVLVATTVRIEDSGGPGGGEFDVRGSLVTLDATAKTFVVRNVVVSYAGTVDFRDGTAADLAVGREVEARGALSADGTQLRAARIDFRH